jgi:carboxyl-terminal processing protease
MPYDDRRNGAVRWRPTRNRFAIGCLVVLFVLSTPGWLAAAGQADGTPVTAGTTGVELVHGAAGSDIGLGGDAPPFAALTDLTAYLDRDLTEPLDRRGQVIVPLRVDASQPNFDLALPARPLGRPHAFGSSATDGVQVFSVNVHADLGGSPFLDPFEYSGWPTSFSSLRLATGTWEIVGGMLIVWADGTGQNFPSDVGTDGLLLTDDDPVAPLDAGWTAIDLDTRPFALSREATVDVPIDSGFGGNRDLSSMSYVDSFDRLIANLRSGYPFTDLKAIDWDRIVATYRPEIVDAEAAGDLDAYTGALMRMSIEIGDGHLAVSPSLDILRARYGGSTGLRLARTDQGQVLVTGVTDGSPARRAGIRPGATIIAWDGLAPADVITATNIVRPVSTSAARLAQQVELLPLGPVGSEVELTVLNAGETSARTVTLKRTEDIEPVDRLVARDDASLEQRVHSPVESRLIDPATGYIRVSTFATNPALIVAAWDHAVAQIQLAGAESIVVDLRGNPGGVLSLALYLAGTFITEPVNLADLSIRSDGGVWGLSGKLIVRPNDALWRGATSVLIDSGCLSACEVLAAALAANPATIVAGTGPTGGAVATVNFWALPGGGVFQAPLGRFEQRGGVWLEGQGVTPTLDVPVTPASILSSDDEVLNAAVAALAG